MNDFNMDLGLVWFSEIVWQNLILEHEVRVVDI